MFSFVDVRALGNENLQVVKLRSCNISDDMAGMFIYVLKNREEKLKLLHLADNPISSNVFTKLTSYAEEADDIDDSVSSSSSYSGEDSSEDSVVASVNQTIPFKNVTVCFEFGAYFSF